jgi:hypothetical protein
MGPDETKKCTCSGEDKPCTCDVKKECKENEEGKKLLIEGENLFDIRNYKK